MHEDYQDDAVEFEGIGNLHRLVRLYVLSPVDLAISKISRFMEQDRTDSLDLASRNYFTADELEQRALAALGYYVGDLKTVMTKYRNDL
jgi:hypothetical protein